MYESTVSGAGKDSRQKSYVQEYFGLSRFRPDSLHRVMLSL
jgi:hypothetical protein